MPSLGRRVDRTLLERLSGALRVLPSLLATATKLARDHCVEAGRSVSRQRANTVRRGLLFNGFNPATDGHGVEELVSFLCGVVVSPCRWERVTMSKKDRLVMVEWAGVAV